MHAIDIRFILMGIVYAVLGTLLGLWMGVSEDLTHQPLHAHINLVGWATMALFGLIYRAYPALGLSKLAAVHFWLMALGTPIMLIGIPLAHAGETVLPAVVGSIGVIGSVVLFLVLFASRGRADA